MSNARQNSDSPLTEVKTDLSPSKTKLINVAGFDWDDTLLPFFSGGYLFLLGDDNKEDHEALKPVLLELLGDYTNKRKCFTELAKFIDRIFIHTQGIEVELVDENGDSWPNLFYSGKVAIEKYLEALLEPVFGKDWKKLISGIHCINTEDSVPIKKSVVCITKSRYEELRDHIKSFRNRFVVRDDKGAFKLKTAPPKEDITYRSTLSEFARAASHLQTEIQGETFDIKDGKLIPLKNGLISFNKPLRVDQNNLTKKAIHCSDELKNIKDTDPDAQINYLFMIDDSETNCLNLTACQSEFKDVVKKFITIHHCPSRRYLRGKVIEDAVREPEGWFRAIQLAMSKDEKDIADFQQRTIARSRYRSEYDNDYCMPDKTFYTDLETEIKSGNQWVVENFLWQHTDSQIKERIDDYISLTIAAAKCVNAATDTTDLKNRHQIFFKLLGKILTLTKKSTHSGVLKACHMLFKHPEIETCLANIKKKTSLIEFLVYSEYRIFGCMQDPLTTIKYFLEFVKDNEINDPKQNPLVVNIMSKKENSRDTIEIVKQLIEERGLGFEGVIKKSDYIGDPVKSALSFSVGYDPDDKDRFGLCKYLLSKGANINDIAILFAELIEQNNLSGIKYICEKTPFNWANFSKMGLNPIDLVCEKISYKRWGNNGPIEPDIKPKERLALAKYFIDLGLRPTINLDEMLHRCSDPDVIKFINEVLKPAANNPDIKPKEFKQIAETTESKNSPAILKSSFDPLYKWVSYLTAHSLQVNEKDFDELVYYARWFFASGGTIQQLTSECDLYFATNKSENTTLLNKVYHLVAATNPPVQTKSLEQLKREFSGESSEVKFPLPKEMIESVSKRFETIERYQNEIKSLDFKAFNERFAATVAACKSEFKKDNSLVTEHTNELLALLRYRYWHITGLYPNNVQMFNLIALITDPDKYKLAQIKTGQGKTTLIALLSAYYGLLGLKPDVFTTHDDLAIRDVEKLSPFYNSVGLTVDYETHSKNTDQSVDILYGTTRTIQGNWLGSETGLYNTRGNRPLDIAIFDEADNLFIDSKHISLRLLFNGIDYSNLIHLYKKVDEHFFKKQIHPEKWISDLAQEMKVTLKEGEATKLYKAWANDWKSVFESPATPEVSAFYAKITAHFDQNLATIAELAKTNNVELKKGDAKQIFKDWALARHFLKIKEDYHVTYDENGDMCVELIDKDNTGQREINMRLNKAHTFLEIINDLPPDMKVAIFCLISNIEFLKLYKYGCKCVTGTGGEGHDRHELLETCGMSTYDSPSNQPDIKIALANTMALEVNYKSRLIETVKEYREKKQPIVIFAETVAQSDRFAEILRESIGQEYIQVYNALQNATPRSISDNAGLPGMVTIVTNIGGRGMDIVTSNEHPLHLIFTNLFKNKRVESQAIGRTGRQGRKGTYSYLLPAEYVCQKLLEPKSAAEKLMVDCDGAIARWYENQREETLLLQKTEFVRLRVTHVIQILQHLFMTLQDNIRISKFYRWTSFISEPCSYENTKELSGDKLEMKAIENSLINFINFWQGCRLGSDLLNFMLSKPEHEEVAKVFRSYALAHPNVLMGLRSNSMYTSSNSKSVEASDSKLEVVCATGAGLTN